MAAVQNNNNPLPPPPPPTAGPRHDIFSSAQPPSSQHQPLPPTTNRPRTKSRTFSFRSDKSPRKSAGSNHHRAEYLETSAEKEANRLHTHADPTMAMYEAEPSAVQATVKSSLASLRNVQHRDVYGNPIAEPDKSNPTRSRWERPLDTIRSFEAAIDGGYNSRRSIYRSDSESQAQWNRRSSYYASNNNGNRPPQDGYYGGRTQPTPTPRPDMHPNDMRHGSMSRESYLEPGGFTNGYGPNGRYSPAPASMGGRQRLSRMATDPQFANSRQPDPSVYPIPSNHRSYETVASATGSGTSAEPPGYQTDPTSSDNSSVERMQAPPKPKPEQQQPTNDYGIGFSQPGVTYQPSTFTVGINSAAPNNGRPAGYPMNGGQPPPLQKSTSGSMLRKPIALNSTPSAAPAAAQPAPEKRKSWFARRFSRQT